MMESSAAGIVIFAVVCVCVACAVGSARALGASRRQHAVLTVFRLERKLDRIAEHLGIDVSVGVDEEIRDLLQTRGKILAIRRYRELNPGIGLREAKDYVDQFER